MAASKPSNPDADARATPFRLHVDTGGTFTDVLGATPDGAPIALKTLSSGVLRGRVLERPAPGCLRIEPGWIGPDDFPVGCVIHALASRRSAIIRAFDASSGLLDLESNAPEDLAPGAGFEIETDLEAPVLAAHLATATPLGEPLPPIRMRLATTRGTNALLERAGAPTALFLTAGFADLLLIGDQRRPDLFALKILRPAPLHASVHEVLARLGADGSEQTPLDEASLRAGAREALDAGAKTAAVALFHADINPVHERRVAEILREAGFDHVSTSAELAPFIKILPRAQTTLANAYLAPVIDAYLDCVEAALEDAQSSLLVMSSAGGLSDRRSFAAKDSLLSGPAGGVAGAAGAGARSGITRLISFDMGGTSTDVARYDNDHAYVFETRVGDARILAPALAIETVAAGGGSICGYDGQALFVGPRSAGASPGPACYGAGGPLTLTDVNLLLGRLDPDRFNIPVDERAAGARLDEVRDAMRASGADAPGADELLQGFLDIADERMADAIRRISLREGYDPAAFALLAFGGAGAQHACGVAERLDISTIIVPENAGLLSAAGLAAAPLERFAERQIMRRLVDAQSDLADIAGELESEAISRLRDVADADARLLIRRRIVELRYIGQDSTISLELEGTTHASRADRLRSDFESAHRNIYGHAPESRPIEITALRVVASTETAPVAESPHPVTTRRAMAARSARACFAGEWRDVAVYERSDLTPGDELEGPALILEEHSAASLDAGWECLVDAACALRLSRAGNAAREQRASRPRAVRRELFTNRLSAIAREMGELLERTALSTNVKERLDFSCGILDADGQLVVNAPHMPVHLGAMGLCVRALMQSIDMSPGDVVATNHPAFGGSHLPDLTVVTPIFDEGDVLLGFAASRAHHAEIGGDSPGSMPADSTTLAEEGVVIPPTFLMRAGEPRWDAMRDLLRAAPAPPRAVEENIADLDAAVAANRRGVEALRDLFSACGDEAGQHMNAIAARAERRVRAVIERFPEGPVGEAEEILDDGAAIRVRVAREGDRLIIDFDGTAETHPANLNAPLGVTRAATLYALRLLVDEPIPLNEGMMRPVDLRVPRGMLNPDFSDDPHVCPAVAGGNVETSQRVVDALLRALGLCAASQGTMNNVTFGTDDFGYYETVCGGSGAGPAFPGADAVHTHMTNTRITDPEILERRYPVRLDRFAIRRGAGGSGRHTGGDGAIRQLTFLEPALLSILTGRRTRGAPGAAGGGDGEPGAQRITRANGEIEHLPPIARVQMKAGDQFTLETPGGGGWGDDA